MSAEVVMGRRYRVHGSRLRTYIDLDRETVAAVEALAQARRWTIGQALREVAAEGVAVLARGA